jgi:hypothetical protein
MTAVEALWHLLNALAAPFGLAVLSTAAVKLLWRQATAGRLWPGLFLWAYLPAVVAHLGTWSYVGAEGSMMGYVLMVAACSVGLWLRVFILPPHR